MNINVFSVQERIIIIINNFYNTYFENYAAQVREQCKWLHKCMNKNILTFFIANTHSPIFKFLASHLNHWTQQLKS